MHVRTVTTATFGAALLVTALAPAANAAKFVHDDPAGDMVRADVEWEEIVPAPEQTEGDITKFVVDHKDTKIIIKAGFAALHRPQANVLYYLPVVTNEELRRNVVLTTNPDDAQGELDLTGPGSCGGLDSKVDYANDMVWFKVPRSCLSGPNWVKVGFGMARDTEIKSIPYSYIDDAMLEGEFGQAKPKLGPKVFRG
jgi:hypothetical protein